MDKNKLVRKVEPRIRELRTSIYLLQRNLLTRIAIIVIALMILIVIFAPLIAPYPEDATIGNNPANALQPMSVEHWLGTDELGRDIFSRLIYGARISIISGVVTIFFAISIGVSLGVIAGCVGGVVDDIIMRVADAFLSFPNLLLAIFIAAMLEPSLTNAQLAITISWWPYYARLLRGQAISVNEKQFVKAAEAIGTPKRVIIFKHVLPNCMAPVVINASMDIGAVILVLASLSFLGLGAQPPTPEWGLMVSTSKNYFMNAWWYAIFPGVCIFVTVLSFNILGDGLREILDPKTRKN